MQKLWGFEFACWIYPGDGPESPAAPESPPQMTGVSGPWFSLPFDPAVVRYCIGVRRYPGDGPESPAHRSRSEEHTSELQSPLIISYAVFCLPLYRGPEFPRRWTGVSGPPESPARGPGISGPLFSQPTLDRI